MTETFYEVMRRQGITRRSFLKYCSLTAAALGLGAFFRTENCACDGNQTENSDSLATRFRMHLLLGIIYPFCSPLGKRCHFVDGLSGLR